MDYRDSPGEAAFRAELKAWLADYLEQHHRPSAEDGFEYDVYDSEWHKRLYDGGWLGLSWPKEYGGRGLTPIYDAILNEEVGKAGAPQVPHVSFLGRALLDFGTEEQKKRFLPGLLSGKTRWCQGFSEPGAGSDLAAMRTTATRRGDLYYISGQKIWTSRAQFATKCLLLARSNPSARKHEGISAFVVDMKQPGVDCRPIEQITGSRAFCEVFFDDATVSVERRIGEEGQGWKLAIQTLAYERGPADIGFISKYQRLLRQVEDEYSDLQKDDAGARRLLGQLHVSIESLRLAVLQSLSDRERGVKPGPESSIGKLLMSETDQLLGHTIFDLRAADAVLGLAPEALYTYLYSRAATIYGGTSQIQKNIIATRLLGLPKS